MRLDVFSTRAEGELAVADEITALIRAHPTAVLGLASGDSPRGIYRELCRRHVVEGLDLGKVRTFSLDEYLGLASSDPRSFQYLLRTQFLEPAGVPTAGTMFLGGLVGGVTSEPEAVARACVLFEQAIRDAGGIDLQLLGIGRNGHVAFNEPGADRWSRTRLVTLQSSTREDVSHDFGGLAHVPTQALTMGVATILEARSLRILAFGERKRPIVARTRIERANPAWPASFLHEHVDTRLVVDAAAADRF